MKNYLSKPKALRLPVKSSHNTSRHSLKTNFIKWKLSTICGALLCLPFSMQLQAAPWHQEVIQSGQLNDNFATTFDFSENGRTVAIRSVNPNPSVSVYQRNGCTWNKKGGDLLGKTSDMAVSDDGNTYVVSSLDYATEIGEVKVFRWDGTFWNQLGPTISVSDPIYFGAKVTIDGEGDTIAVSADHDWLDFFPSVYVYDYTGSGWNLVGSHSIRWPSKLKLSDDGDRLVVSANERATINTFERSSGFSSSAIPVMWDHTFHAFDLSDDGNVLVVSAESVDAVQRYEWDGAMWSHIGIDLVESLPEEYSGVSLGLSGDGSKLIVGSPFNGPKGKATIYEWSASASSWLQIGSDIVGQHAGAYAGTHVAMSEDGLTVGVRTKSSPSAFNQLGVFSPNLPISYCIELDSRVLLEGPFFSNDMYPNLAFLNSNPEKEPYSLEGYAFPEGSGGGETSDSKIFQSKNIVDWVVVEIRDSNSDLVWAKSALVSSDGKVVDVDGVSEIVLPDFITDGQSYHLGLHHRNHVDVMALEPIKVSNNTVTVDFTDPATPTSIQTKMKSGENALIAGDATGDNCVTNEDIKQIKKDKNAVGYWDSIINEDSMQTSKDKKSAEYWNSDINMLGDIDTKDITIAKKNIKKCM